MLTNETFSCKVSILGGTMKRDRAEYFAEYYKRTKDLKKEQKAKTAKIYHEKNKDRLNQQNREYYAKNRDTVLTRIKKAKKIAYDSNPQQDLAKQKEWKKKNPDKYLLQNAKTRAKKQGVPFEITVEDICIPNVCPYLGIKIEPFSEWNYPSLDKIIPELGYVKGNIQVISNLANTMKSSASIEQSICFAENVLKLHRKDTL